MYQEIREEVLEMYSGFQDQVKHLWKWLWIKGGGEVIRGLNVNGEFAFWSLVNAREICLIMIMNDMNICFTY